MKKQKNIPLCLLIILFFSLPSWAQDDVIYREAKSTLTPIEMNIGDTVNFKLRNGEVRTMVLLETGADVVITNLNELKRGQPGGATLYHFTSIVSIDGHHMKMERYVGSQESFYEPYVINGMRIWFDGVSKIPEIILAEHGGKDSEAIPNKDARFAITDMSDKIGPVHLYPLYNNERNFINIVDSYNGDDVWMGAYNGFEVHGGLDINMPQGTPNFTPFPIDDHYLFNSLAEGDNNNRWRGIHEWPNGDVWTIQNHHMLNLLIPEHVPIESGIHYADAAGVHVGSNEHAHYVFKTKTQENEHEILLDPWIIFWQVFENNKSRSGEIKASMSFFSPGETGESIFFRSDGSNSGQSDSKLSYYWTFGDGGFSNEANPEYTYLNPGIYSVTLVVDDGAQKASFTQHLTIDGSKINKPGLALKAIDELSFRIRPTQVMDVYDEPVQFTPHTVHFFARATRPKPNEKRIKLVNKGGGILPKAIPEIFYSEGKEWLSIEHEGEKNDQELIIAVDATGLSTGVYTAMVQVDSPGAFNSTQGFLVQLTIPTYPPAHGETRDQVQEIIDNSDIRSNRFYSTPYFWVAPRFKRWNEKGYNNFYLTNGGRAVEGQFARFTPDLEAGKYEVFLAEETPFDPKRRAKNEEGQQPVNSNLNPDPRFAVRVRSSGGDEIIWMKPMKSKKIGTFEFEEGMDGFVEILSGGSRGQVLVDAIIFKKAD